MIKTHKISGLKYLCQTKQNPFTYQGSGKDWIPHLEQYGKDQYTEILMECHSKEELKKWGRYYSRLWNVVDAQDDFGNKIWANRIPETGGGNGGIISAAGKKRKSIAAKTNNERMKNLGIHPFVGGDVVRQQIKDGKNVFVGPAMNATMLANGTHASQNTISRQKNSNSQKIKVNNGTHHLLGGRIQRQLVEAGIHSLQRRPDGTSHNTDKIAAGTHNFLGSATQKNRVKNGTHPSCTKISCLTCKGIFSLNTFGRHSKKCT